MPLYRNILKQAWKITWTNKYLWFFGIFAALLGNGGEYEILLRGITGETGPAVLPAWSTVAATGLFSRQAFANLGLLMRENTLSLVMLLVLGLIILALAGFLIWLTVVSQIALVNNSACATGRKRCDFKGGVETGIKNFWAVLGLNITYKIAIFLTFLIVGLPLILGASHANAWAGNLLYIIAFTIFMALILAISFIIKYSIAYNVLKGERFCDSLKAGWKLFKKNWLVSLEMAFILFFINFIIGLGLVVVVFILALPFVFSALLLYKLISLAAFWIVAFLAFLVLLAVVVLVGAALAAFQISSWTSLFLELVNRGGISKIVRLASGWMKD